ncbi:Uncharacterised protein [Yersinia intermedia]|uniref:Uncharacterized protein n=1 Tax=Yersinia intermedia TaxID=631 RepID=A0A0H5LZS7_YERIN|nr:hypothetical protein [Yersinia intermedia]CRY56555.1 Uncharacterised protein [Yersinia intermedia]
MNKKKNKLLSWKQGLMNNEFQIIHTISSTGGLGNRRCASRFLGERFEDVISSWDIMSCSLLSYSKGKGVGAFPTHLVLDVPYQNIIGTHLSDVYFPNHAGKFEEQPTGRIINSYELVDRILNGQGVGNVALGSPYNKLEYFKRFIQMMDPDCHNEILVVCKPELLIVKGVHKTGRVKLKDIVYNVKGNSLNEFVNDIQAVKKVAEINQLTSVSFIFHYGGKLLTNTRCNDVRNEINNLFGNPIYSSFGRSNFENNCFSKKLRTAPNLSYPYHPSSGYMDVVVYPVK